MADPKDQASATPDPKPAGKSAAVKPPVLEGTARPAGVAKTAAPPKPAPAASPESPKPDAAKPAPADAEADKAEFIGPPAPPPVRADESGAGAAWLAGLVGGVIGLGAAYGLALLGYWPVPAPVTPPEDPRIGQVSSLVPELQTVTSTLQDELATLSARVGGLESTGAAPAGDPAQVDQLAGDIAALSARLDDLSAAPQQTQDASAASQAAIANLEAELNALRQSAAQTEAELGTVSGQVASLQADMTEGSAAEAGQARLPLIVSGFETALSTGSPYEAELSALRQALPNLAVPGPVAANAMDGIKRPDLIARDFNAVLPDILAGRPVSSDASWQESTSDWFRGILAIRPTEAVEGDGPEAIVARLEGAIARADFVAAKTEFDALPPSMRSAAGSVGDDIADQAAAQAFLTSLRQAALSGGNGA